MNAFVFVSSFSFSLFILFTLFNLGCWVGPAPKRRREAPGGGPLNGLKKGLLVWLPSRLTFSNYNNTSGWQQEHLTRNSITHAVAVVYPTALTVLVTVAFANWRTIQPEPVARPHPNQTKRRNSTSRENDEETPRNHAPLSQQSKLTKDTPLTTTTQLTKLRKRRREAM